MTSEDYFCFFIYFLVPILFMIWWIRMRLGLDKRWFVMPSAPLISRNFYFALPAAMTGFAIGVVGGLLVALNPYNYVALYFYYITFGLLILSFVFAYLEPNWMSPEWYRWLKRNHGDIMPYLALDAHEMGRDVWMQRVETQEDLEEWAAEVRRKYGAVNSGLRKGAD